MRQHLTARHGPVGRDGRRGRGRLGVPWFVLQGVPDLRVRITRVRNPDASANYLMKNMIRDKAELPPKTWKGRLVGCSGEFLAGDWYHLWQESVRRTFRTAIDDDWSSPIGDDPR